MKAKYWVFIVLLFPVIHHTHVNAQEAGIFLSHADYELGKLSFTKGKSRRYRLMPNKLLQAAKITVTIDDTTYSFRKDSVYGYSDGVNNLFRFYEGKEFIILNPSEQIPLYTIEEIENSKQANTAKAYFFSISSNTAILPLKKSNLLRAFRQDTGFQELIDIYFKQDADLIDYDSFNRIYKINRIYKLYQKKNETYFINYLLNNKL